MGSQRDQTADARVQEGLMQSKENDAAAEGCWQRLWSRKIRFVYFLVVLLTLLIVIIVLAVTRPQPAKASSTAHEKIQCDDGWITYNRTCYYLSNDRKSWTDSQTYCTERKSSLAIFDNTEEYDFLQNIKGDQERWIGLSNKGDGSGWVRADGTRYSPNIFQIGQAINLGDMGYAYLTSKGLTSTTRGDLPKTFFCKKKLFT